MKKTIIFDGSASVNKLKGFQLHVSTTAIGEIQWRDTICNSHLRTVFLPDSHEINGNLAQDLAIDTGAHFESSVSIAAHSQFDPGHALEIKVLITDGRSFEDRSDIASLVISCIT